MLHVNELLSCVLVTDIITRQYDVHYIPFTFILYTVSGKQETKMFFFVKLKTIMIKLVT